MTDAPSASIIIPCYNNAEYIADAIESALGQSHPATEVIVIDDGSTDGSAAIIESFGDKITFLRQSNHGACIARNNGFKASKGQWIKFLDGDDKLLPHCIATQIEQTKGREVVVVGDYEVIGEFRAGFKDTHYLEVTGVNVGTPFPLNAFFETSIFISTPLYPRAVIERFGAFDPTVRRGQEHEFSTRLYINGVEFEYHPVLCFYYRQHDGASRISNARRLESYLFDFERFLAFLDRAETGPRSADFASNKKVLARSAWRRGRRLLRAGEEAHAQPFFDKARSIAGSDAIVGGNFYMPLARLFGPAAAEAIAGFAQRMRGRMVEFDDLRSQT